MHVQFDYRPVCDFSRIVRPLSLSVIDLSSLAPPCQLSSRSVSGHSFDFGRNRDDSTMATMPTARQTPLAISRFRCSWAMRRYVIQ
jgi:hypothetical protein